MNFQVSCIPPSFDNLVIEKKRYALFVEIELKFIKPKIWIFNTYYLENFQFIFLCSHILLVTLYRFMELKV